MTIAKKTLLITLDFPPLQGGIAEYYLNRVKKMDTGKIVVLVDGFETCPSGRRVGNLKFDIGAKIFFKKFLRPYIYPHWLPLIKHIYFITKKEKIEELWAGQVLPVGTAVWLVSKILHLPYIVTCHGNDLLRAKVQTRKWKLAKKILASAELVEANTEFTKNILINDFNVPAEKIEVVYPENTLRRDMVDEKKVAELREKHNLTGKKVLLTVARLVESKGIDTVISALPEIWKSVPNLVYLIVGEGEDKLRLTNIMDKRVIFTGAVPHNELPTYYTLADAFILTPHKTGIDTESFGLVYLEAAEFGLPIIAGDVGGAREALSNYNKAVFVDSENKEKIVEEIKIVISNQISDIRYQKLRN